MSVSKPEKGVFQAKKKDGTVYYRASLTYRRKHISLGSFSDPEQAHRAYLEGTLLLSDPRSNLLSYSQRSQLPFEKWVVLLNFRDNGLYFGTPIYLGRKMFSYYLSPTRVLKFDLDDLFYFSSHKIMCRGNHYFVADYGMQLSIAARYGIMSYAVPGRDYHFRNGDPLDFRRDNLEILNAYRGVSLETKKGRSLYAARIHIRGNYVVGRYGTSLEAAVAYNKAIDILKKNGLKKEFQPNYIEDLSPAGYAEIYSQVKISPKIMEYRPADREEHEIPASGS